VTIKDAFSADRGYGFQSTEGLLAFDRGGAEITRPEDEYTARTYGSYRMTSDATCALIEGTTNNAFQVSLPDGQYTVWLIASDAEWDPPLFEVRVNGQKKLDVRIPRARFVFMEPFQAQATGGNLRIEFVGTHGWILNGLVVGREGPELASVVSKLDRDIFFLTDPETPNWKEVKPEPANPPLEWTAVELQKGYVAFPVDYTERILPTFTAERGVVGRPLTAFATPGEFEPASFCISARKDLGQVSVELADFVRENGKQTIARQNVKVGIVRCWPQRASDRGGKGEYQIVPEMIEPPVGRDSSIGAGQLKQWWLTVDVPSNAPPGRYRMSITVRPENAVPAILEWRLLVLPFQLTRATDKHWGTWFDSFPPVGGLYGPARRGRDTPQEVDRVARADIADFREHGFDLVLLNYYFGAKENPDGSFSYDVSKLAQDLEYCKLLGSKTPVVVTIEYACRNLEYQYAEPGQKHVPGTFSPKAHKAIVGLVQHIHNEALRHPDWPKLYFYPIDEPGNNKTENRMLFAQNVLDFVHEVPGCQTATTLSASEVQRLGDRVDVRIYAYGCYNRGKVLQETHQGHPFWWYENGMFYGHSTTDSRGMAGFEFLRSRAEVATAWGFAATQANPYNDFDGGHKDWNVIFPGVDSPAPTIYWELCREGVDDCRYVATLQEQIRLAKTRGNTRAVQRAEAVLEPLLDPESAPIENPAEFARYRWRIAREILNLLGDQTLAVSFTAVMKNARGPEKVGPNVILDPSFEAGPMADGFPGVSYNIADRDSSPDQRPMGALSVTDEVAHSGRYSLKWDFSKAPRKGYVYDGKRYLIVNVQVAQEAARQLLGKRVKVGYWFRLGGGAAVPGMTLREFSNKGFLDSLSFTGGVDDPAVWNHFEAQGRLRDDFESLDIHISCPLPDDPELANKSVFYIDDVSLQAIEEPPLAISTALDEYYIGEEVHWKLSALPSIPQVRIQFLEQDRVISQQSARPEAGLLQGHFETLPLKPGIYTLRAESDTPGQPREIAEQQFIVALDPFAWSNPSQ
jgi:hypothetical protein